MAKVQVSKDFFDGVYWLLDDLKDYELDATTKAICNFLQHEINVKQQAIERREVFTAYKTAEKGSADRETKRQEYLDRAEVHKDWRSQQEHFH